MEEEKLVRLLPVGFMRGSLLTYSVVEQLLFKKKHSFATEGNNLASSSKHSENAHRSIILPFESCLIV